MNKLAKIRQKPGGSNVGKKTFADGSKRTGPYVGQSGGAPAGSYPIPDLCISEDTIIPLLDGTEHKIKDLCRREGFWVYSYDLQSNRIVPGWAHSARLTVNDAETLNVLLDNGITITCTGNHPFLMRSGEYKTADKLSVGDSIMPLYRDKKSIRGGKDYERIWQPWDKRYDFTHVMSWREHNKHYINDDSIIHHKNNNQLDNRPNNLEIMNRASHCRLHGELDNWVNTQKLIEGGRKFWREDDGSRRKVWSDRTKAMNKRFKEMGLDIGKKITEAKLKYTKEEAEHFHKIYIGGDSLKNVAKQWGCSVDSVKKRFKREGLPRKKDIFAYNNHKVVSITKGDNRNVYDLTVDKYNNFAISAGVFVHNSHARAALALAHHAPNPEGIQAAVKRKYPQLAKYGGKIAYNYDLGGDIPNDLYTLDNNHVSSMEIHSKKQKNPGYYNYGGKAMLHCKDGGWISKAINPAHKGFCSPLSKSTCTGHRRALARTLKKMAKNK